MNFYYFLRLLCTTCLGGWLIISFAPWPSRTIIYHRENFQCSIPENWNVTRTSHFVMRAHRILGGSFDVLASHPSVIFQIDNPSFSEAFRKKLLKDGFEIVDEDRQPFAGQPAYSITFRKAFHGHVVYSHSTNFVANGFYYSLDVVKQNYDPMEDTELVRARDSFKLLPPVP